MAKPRLRAALLDFSIQEQVLQSMNKEKLIEIIQGLLDTDIDLGFLVKLKQRELELLVACVRGRVDLIGR